MASVEVTPTVETVAAQIERRAVRAARKIETLKLKASKEAPQEKRRREPTDQQEWANVFDLVMELFERTRSGSAHLQLLCCDRIPVNKADFRCDVDIAARKVLTAAEYRMFSDVYTECTVREDAVPVAIMAHIKSRCGRIWKKRKLHHLYSYFHENTRRPA